MEDRSELHYHDGHGHHGNGYQVLRSTSGWVDGGWELSANHHRWQISKAAATAATSVTCTSAAESATTVGTTTSSEGGPGGSGEGGKG